MNIPHTRIRNRKTIRLQKFDYSQNGLYFITICIKDRECLFGEITDAKIILNDAGKIADKCWLEIPIHFPDSVLHEHIIMPNHVHGIIELKRIDSVRISHVISVPDDIVNNVGLRHVVALQNQFSKPIPGSVSVIIQQYKSSVKRFCNKNNFSHFQWQSRFYEHIIRNKQSCDRIADYIISNPKNWMCDIFY